MPLLVYDITLRRPGCALLQAAFGVPGSIAARFPTEDWLLSPTPDLKVYTLTDEQLKKVIAYHAKEALNC